MNFSRSSVTLYVLLVFCSGIAIGVFGHSLYTATAVSTATSQKPEEWRKRYIGEMEARLKLKPEQVKNLGSILDETRVRFHEVRERTKPEFDSIRKQQVDKVKAILDDSQRAEYEKMRAEREAREKAQGHPPGPGL